MKRSIKAAGFFELKDRRGIFFHPETGAYGKLLKRSFRICCSRPRKRNGKDATNRRSLKPLEEVWQVTPGAGMTKIIRELVKDAMPVGSAAITAELLERMSDRLRCGSSPSHIQRARGGVGRTRPSFKAVAGWSPAKFRNG
jgi:hypothetical protein